MAKQQSTRKHWSERITPFGFKSHDVRRLKVCSLCQQPGIYRPKDPVIHLPIVICINSLPAMERTKCLQPSFLHPRCCVEYFGGSAKNKLLDLHFTEHQTIRICDLPAPQFRMVMRELERRRRTSLPEHGGANRAAEKGRDDE